MSRQALVWNFEDDNFTWMDASAVVGTQLSDVFTMHYGFEPGYAVAWAQWELDQTDWQDLALGNDLLSQSLGRPVLWSDLSKPGKDRNMYWLTKEGVWLGDQKIDKSGVKKYYVERKWIDFDDVVQGWTSYNYKHVRQLFPLLQTPARADIDVTNTYTFTIGWSNNLMDEPEYKEPITLNLNKTDFSGKHKIDVRTTGRYMAMRWDFTYTDEINMTAVDIDMEEAHGR